MPSPVRALIFDIGNVLLRFDFNLALEKLAHDSSHAAEKILELIEPIKAAYEAGRMTRADFQAETRAILKFTGTDADFVAAWEDIFTENEPMVQMLPALAAQVPLYLLSNTSDIHRDFIFRRYPFFAQNFKAGIYSYEVAAYKPEPEIYHITQRQLGVNPAETLFVDDLLANVEAARAIGFQAHHYHHDEHEKWVDRLRQAGLV